MRIRDAILPEQGRGETCTTLAQPFFVWAQHERIARGYLFGSDPRACFVDNFLTVGVPVRSPAKPKPVRKPAAKKPARRKFAALASRPRGRRIRTSRAET